MRGVLLSLVLLSVVLMAGMVNSALAKEEACILKGMVGINLSQTSVSKTWSGGEKNALSWTAYLESSVEYNWGWNNWLNSLKLEYGKTEIEEQGSLVSRDRFDFDSVYTFNWKRYLNPYFAFAANSQFSNFFDPAIISQSFGAGAHLLQTEKQTLKTRMGAAIKEKFASQLTQAEIETGIESVSHYEFIFLPGAKFTSELQLFSTFAFKGVDLRWDTGIYYNLGKWLTAKLGYLLIYDHEEDKTQWPQDIESRLLFTLGFSYALF